jgi:chromosome segregation ATPase
MTEDTMQQQPAMETPQPKVEMFTRDEVEEMMKARVAKTANDARQQREENENLKKRLEELQRKQDSGTATTEERSQLQTAKTAEIQAHQQGYTREEAEQYAMHKMDVADLDKKLTDAREKDPEFKDLLEKGNKLYEEEVKLTAGIPNAPAVVKQLLKDRRDLNLYRAYISSGNLTDVISFLNDMSRKLESTEQKPHPSGYEPSPVLAESSGDQEDTSDYIGSRY